MKTVQSIRNWAATQSYTIRTFVDHINDQRIREIIMQAESQGVEPEDYILWIMMKKPDLKKPAEEPKKQKTPRKRKQEGCVTVEGVMLTPKQLEFMERLQEIPNWGEKQEEGSYVVSDYAAELADTMSVVSVGAMVTTLREKNILTTEKYRIDGARGCVFTLTDLGRDVYRGLKNGNYV